MRPYALALALGALTASLPFAAAPASAATHHTAQTADCSRKAKEQNLTGADRTAFLKTCQKGPLASPTPTAPTASSKEAQAVTKPSGVDRTTRTRQCAAEADSKKLVGKDRSAFQLSCLATAGPVSEGETGTKQPHPSNQINGIGENNYKPSATTGKSTPNTNPPEIAKKKQ